MKILIKPLSVNNCWQGKRFKTPTYKSYEKELLGLLPDIEVPLERLKIEITFGFSSTRSDLDNPQKPFLDILQKRYNFNDSKIYELHVFKDIVLKGEEFIEFKIKEL